MRKLTTCFFAFIFLFITFFSLAQQSKVTVELSPVVDSLIQILKYSKEDTTIVNALNELSWEYLNKSNYEQALKYAKAAQSKGEKPNYKKGIATAYINMGSICYYQGNYSDALNNYQESLKIKEEIGDKQGIASSHNNIGNVYYSQGNLEKSLDNYLQALKLYESIMDKPGIAASYVNIGNIYYFQGNYNKVLDNYLKSLKIVEEIGDKQGMAHSYDNIGLVYYEQKNYEKSLDCHLKALKSRQEIGNKQGIANSYNNIGNVYLNQEYYEKALENYLKGLRINKDIGSKEGIANSYKSIGQVYLKQKQYKESNYFLDQSLGLFKEIGNKDGIREVYFSLSDLHERNGDYGQAYKYHKLFSEIKDTLLNEQSNEQIEEMNTKYDSEKKDKELIKKDAEISKQQAETEKQNLQRNAFIIGFALVLVLAFFIYRGYRQKQTANGLLEEKNILIENQKELVEEKNLKITDSINYAKRIQQATLPSLELIKSFLPESFIFFKPKDIVSGDFYWFSEKNDKLLIAVADCTGHGVPGAFMSMIGNTLLNEIVNVKNICEPNEILNQLNKGIISLLHQNDNTVGTQDDGMDITVLAIDKVNGSIEFAGANHFSYLFNKTDYKTLTGDLFSIGGMFGGMEVNFKSQKIKIEKGNTLYLFTDGFIDQFGGEKNTKFLSNRFEELLKSIQQCGIEQQQEKITTAFDKWKGNNKQLDDILIVGIRF